MEYNDKTINRMLQSVQYYGNLTLINGCTVLSHIAQVVVECDSLLTAQNSAIKRYPQCRRLILYVNTIYSVRGILFNGIKSRQNHTAADVFLNCLRYFTLIKSSPISDMRPIGEGLIKRKVFAGAHTI